MKSDKSSSIWQYPETRRAPATWMPYAWAVRALVERGYSVSEASRTVLRRGGEEVTRGAMACVRVRYYGIRKREWPESLRHLDMGNRTVVDQTDGTYEPAEEVGTLEGLDSTGNFIDDGGDLPPEEFDDGADLPLEEEEFEV